MFAIIYGKIFYFYLELCLKVNWRSEIKKKIRLRILVYHVLKITNLKISNKTILRKCYIKTVYSFKNSSFGMIMEQSYPTSQKSTCICILLKKVK